MSFITVVSNSQHGYDGQVNTILVFSLYTQANEKDGCEDCFRIYKTQQKSENYDFSFWGLTIADVTKAISFNILQHL